ncbi:hypothetical protein AAFC00_005431 [Neodothiora populina]|uniref:Carboxylic ester hydrolase n=1 Tax=Neodothiora populina TaxID=2781224 RepID=A0ABR3PKV3_9PEZI
METTNNILAALQWPVLFSNLIKGGQVQAQNCSSAAITAPTLYGAEILSIDAVPLTDFAQPILQPENSWFPVNVTGLDACNVTITYTHPGYNDTIHAYYLLPANWNGRYMSNGGGGYVTGGDLTGLALSAGHGYAAGGTDGGHSATANTSSWGLSSPGNVNWFLLQDFASVSLADAAIMGKQLAESYYGTAPEYSYWAGCSTGGRQGYMMAQRYPEIFDGILAVAPAINWHKFLMGEYYPQLVMNLLGYYPSACEFSAIVNATLAACDNLDGVVDGIISRPDICTFNISSVAGKQVTCPDGSSTTVSSAAVKVAKATYEGARSSSGKFLWYGLEIGSPLVPLAGTTCSNGNTNCTSVGGFPIPPDWIRTFVLANTSYDVTSMSHADYDRVFHNSVQRFASIIGTDDPDLSEYRASGGKLLTWHGLSDQLIPPAGTRDYYSRVKQLDPNVADFYRIFEAPGVQHCGGGAGAYPGYTLDALVAWVENGTAPATLKAAGVTTDGAPTTALLCQYPLVNVYMGGDVNAAASYKCVKRTSSRHQ